jgi:hypothetical protein
MERQWMGTIDDVFHSLFDDFDRRKELDNRDLDRLYLLLECILKDCGDAEGPVFTDHALWPEVLGCATEARRALTRQ